MIYGLYLSATGVLANSYRQDVIANNLANAETVGFKRDLALFQQRATEAQERGRDPRAWSNPLLEMLGGGLAPVPTMVDTAQGEMEQTGNPLDLAIQGDGYLAVRRGRDVLLTRNGRLAADRAGRLVMATTGLPVLDVNGQEIRVDAARPIEVQADGTVAQAGRPVARIGLLDVPDRTRLTKLGGTLLNHPYDVRKLAASSATLRSGFVELSNVEPSSELAAMMDAHRQLEANANLMRYQDQMLSRLVNEVGKIG